MMLCLQSIVPDGAALGLKRLDRGTHPAYAPAMTADLKHISIGQLKQAIRIKQKLETLAARLSRVLGSDRAPAAVRRKGYRMSAAGRAAIRAAQKARWAKSKGKNLVVKTRRRMSAAGRARIAAGARRRWKAAKAAGRTRL
jgi:uncharacterized protein (DUF2132 family)